MIFLWSETALMSDDPDGALKEFSQAMERSQRNVPESSPDEVVSSYLRY